MRRRDSIQCLIEAMLNYLTHVGKKRAEINTFGAMLRQTTGWEEEMASAPTKRTRLEDEEAAGVLEAGGLINPSLEGHFQPGAAVKNQPDVCSASQVLVPEHKSWFHGTSGWPQIRGRVNV